MIDEFGNNVNFIRMPVAAASRYNEDGSYSIFIDERLSDQKRLECYLHELRHINNGDFYKDNVQEIEAEAHSQ